jgi:hypothetical protein
MVLSAALVLPLAGCGSPGQASVRPGELIVTGSENAQATIVCRSDGSVTTATFTWLSGTNGPFVGPAFAQDFKFEPRNGGAAFASIPQYKASAEQDTGTVKDLTSDPAGETAAQLVFPDASYRVRFRCPDGSGPYKGAIATRGGSAPAFEVGFTVSSGNRAVGDLIVYANAVPEGQATGFAFPVLIAHDPGSRPISHQAIDASLTGKLIASDGSASEHTLRITGTINEKGDASGTLDIAGISEAFDGRWHWEATTGSGALEVPIVSPLKHAVSNKGRLLDVANLTYPGGLGYGGGYFLSGGLGYGGGSFTGTTPGQPIYQAPHVGVTLPSDPSAIDWGIKADDSDRATLVYAVSAGAGNVFSWYTNQLSQRGFVQGAGTRLVPGSHNGLVLEMVRDDFDVTVRSFVPNSCPPAYCAGSLAAELAFPMGLIVRAVGNTSANAAAQPVPFPAVCPTPVDGASIVMKGLFSGMATSTCLGLWRTAGPDSTCQGIMQMDYVIGGIPFEISNIVAGRTPEAFAFGSSDQSGSLFYPSPVPNSADEPPHVSAGTLVFSANLYWHNSSASVETVSARVPCAGVWGSG